MTGFRWLQHNTFTIHSYVASLFFPLCWPAMKLNALLLTTVVTQVRLVTCLLLQIKELVHLRYQ